MNHIPSRATMACHRFGGQVNPAAGEVSSPCLTWQCQTSSGLIVLGTECTGAASGACKTGLTQYRCLRATHSLLVNPTLCFSVTTRISLHEQVCHHTEKKRSYIDVCRLHIKKLQGHHAAEIVAQLCALPILEKRLPTTK